MKNTTILKAVILIGLAVAAVAYFWDTAQFKYFEWALANNTYSDDNDIKPLAEMALKFDPQVAIPMLIDRINPTTNPGMPGRRVAQGALQVITEGDYDIELLLEYEHSKRDADDAYEYWFGWWEGAKERAQWDPKTKALTFQ